MKSIQIKTEINELTLKELYLRKAIKGYLFEHLCYLCGNLRDSKYASAKSNIKALCQVCEGLIK